MKKMLVYLSIVVTVASCGGSIVRAEEKSNEQPIGVTPVSITERYWFASKPPKKHKGLRLIRTQKVKNGYMGYYI
ncbi:hypothetical protein IGI37_000718 [Enterococcus sp. AZ194]|uniref:lipoprotein n=1 Tax=Enterococcus sp. AZ194 TaxID=2774629 RepID=UPI003F20469F